jgi:hypothetical protein
MVIKIETTLFHAKWCGHCTRFLPEWKKYASQIGTSHGKIGKINIVAKEFEESTIKSDDALINGKHIKGFPTVKILVHNNGKSAEYAYTGKRTADDLMYHIINEAPKKI